MRRLSLPHTAVVTFTTVVSLYLLSAVEVPAALSTGAQDPQDPQRASADQEAQQMAEQMAQATKFTQPGEKHEALKRFLGTWDSSTSLVMGDRRQSIGSGTTTFDWLMDGRFLRGRTTEEFAGVGAVESYLLLGYDNFKQSYVATLVNSSETAMRHAEGDFDPSGEALICYGLLDEYLTGEHDKMVRYVWRFDSSDHIVLEVHDLAIGETNTQVVEIDYRRKAD